MADNSKTVSTYDKNAFKEPSILVKRKLFMVFIVYFLKSIFKQKFDIPSNYIQLQLITSKAHS